ncbi:hypothetical protein EYF80_036141 [Liparis tanakae]|uniref:Uncharacterized protein n=1 Tax=Liparis tanakae TaxID=230148 RepID=A0A4Z2GLF7_9TELE|nr:hypothetical protein EYF80_036141 [Liparis tanakae]
MDACHAGRVTGRRLQASTNDTPGRAAGQTLSYLPGRRSSNFGTTPSPRRQNPASMGTGDGLPIALSLTLLCSARRTVSSGKPTPFWILNYGLWNILHDGRADQSPGHVRIEQQGRRNYQIRKPASVVGH